MRHCPLVPHIFFNIKSKVMIKIVLSLLCIIFVSKAGAQVNSFYFGFDAGLNYTFNKVLSNDRQYFSCEKECWNERDGFLSRNGIFSFTIGLETSKKMIYELSFSRQTINYNPQFLLPFELIGNGNIGSGIFGSSTENKWSIGAGRKINLGKNFNYVPSIQFAYMFSRQETETPHVITEEYEKYTYNLIERHYRQNQFFAGIKNNFQWRPSRRWILNLTIGYFQGLATFYKVNQEIVFSLDPDTIYKGEKISRLSHSYATIGVAYVFSIR